MKYRKWLLYAVVGLLLVLPSGVAKGQEPKEEQIPGLAEAAQMAPTAITPYGGQIEIAVTGNAESNPSVALCASNEYLAVFEREGDIYGQRLTAEGALLGDAFLVSDGILPASNPDVACEWANNVFVVVWESAYDLADHDVRVQAVHGSHQPSSSQLLGSWLYVVSTGDREGNPAVACNSDDQTCLVVYEKESSGHDSIDGRRVEVTGAGLSITLATFEVTTAWYESNPDVIWNHDGEQFMVVWQHWWEIVSPPSHDVLVFRPFWDTHQGVNQWQTPEYQLILNTHGLGHDQTDPAIAYSRGADEYVVAFQYDYWGDGSDYDIAAIRLGPDGARARPPFYVANTGNHETSPAIAYSGGPEHLTTMYGNPQYLVAYASQEPGEAVLYVQGVKDREDGNGIELDGNRQELDRVSTVSGGDVVAPDATGSAHNGRYLTAWQRNPQQDILGRLAAPYGGVSSIAGTSFVSTSSAHSYEYWEWGGITLAPGGAGSSEHLAASVELPEGVTIASLTIYYYDTNPSEWILLGLSRYDGAGGIDDMAAVVSANDGTNQKTDITINYPTVDNANYTYLLSAEVATGSASPTVILYGAKITYIPHVNAPKGPFSAAPFTAPLPQVEDVATSGLSDEESSTALHTGGTVRLLAPAAATDGEPSKEALDTDGARSVPAPPASEGAEPQGIGAFPLDWKRYTVAAANFHPAYSDTGHEWYSGGARYITSAPTVGNLIAPLNLIHGKTIHRARFTYYDVSAQNLRLWLVQADRQGSGSYIWFYFPVASGGTLVATSPALDTLVDNHNYAYYLVARLGDAVADSDLRAIEVEISYVSETYLPVVLRDF